MSKSPFKREILAEEDKKPTAEALQLTLYDLINLALVGKQAHWNVFGRNFLSIHEQLDVIIAAARAASDEVAERIVQIGVSPDGRAKTVADKSDLRVYDDGFRSVDETITAVSDAMAKTIENLRSAIETLGKHDPISEDIVIGLSAGLEKHLWMLQAQE